MVIIHMLFQAKQWLFKAILSLAKESWIKKGLICTLCCFHVALAQEGALQKHSIEGVAQGTTYHITYFSSQPLIVPKQVDDLLQRIDRSMSLYREDSKISEFNRPEVMKVQLDADFKKVIEKSWEVYRKSAGLFDVTIRPLLLWYRHSARSTTIDSADYWRAKALIGMHYLHLADDTLYKRIPGVAIDLDGIAQGYTVDVLAQLLEENNCQHYLVELGGEIRVKGHKPDGSAFAIGIERPQATAGGFRLVQQVIHLKDGAVTTSGNYASGQIYDQYREVKHLDPLRGQMVSHGVLSVTVIAQDAMTCDAWDNVLMAMDPQRAVAFVDTIPGLEAHLVVQDSNGQIQEWMSKGFQMFILNGK
jgi:thiamine biosynthesis lipoprotein